MRIAEVSGPPALPRPGDAAAGSDAVRATNNATAQLYRRARLIVDMPSIEGRVRATEMSAISSTDRGRGVLKLPKTG
jgi:hypothetical protein